MCIATRHLDTMKIEAAVLNGYAALPLHWQASRDVSEHKFSCEQHQMVYRKFKTMRISRKTVWLHI